MKHGQSGNHCPACVPLARCMEDSRQKPYQKYDAALRTGIALIADGAVELLAGDCPLEEAEDALSAERHFTVCHYLRCRTCGAVYFIGACIRGQPIFRREEPLNANKLERLLWGRCGSYFSGR